MAGRNSIDSKKPTVAAIVMALLCAGCPMGPANNNGLPGGTANVAPVADDQSVEVAFGTGKAITLTGSDADGGPSGLVFSVVTQPGHGGLSGDAPNLTYTPNAHFAGADSFTFKVNDGADDSAAATVSITVDAATNVTVNLAPTASAQNVTVAFNTATGITLMGSDPDHGPSPLSYAVVSLPMHGALVAGATPGDVTYTPTTGYSGGDSFTFTVSDGEAVSAAATVSITVQTAPMADWRDVGGGTTELIKAATVYNGELVVAGSFTHIGGVAASAIAKWNGTAWTTLGAGLNITVHALTVFNGELIAGGQFTASGATTLNRIARWNGTAWSPLGNGVDGSSVVFGLNVFNSKLVVGGFFTSVDNGTAALYGAAWDGAAWSSLNTGMDAQINKFTVYNSKLIAGGWFTQAGGGAAPYVAQYDGTNWSGVGGGLAGSGFVAANDLTTNNGSLIVTGQFNMAGGVAVNNIAAWNGSSWSSMNGGLTGCVVGGCAPAGDVLTVFNGNVVAGGYFTTAGGVQTGRIAQWDGTNWSPFGTGIAAADNAGFVDGLTILNGDLIAVGQFSTAGNATARSVARWGLP